MLELKGGKWDIEALERFLPEGYHVEQHKERQYLVLEDTGLTDYAAAKAEAHHVLNLTNAYASTQSSGYNFVEQAGLSRLDDDGRMCVFLEARLSAVGGGHARLTIVDASGEVEDDDLPEDRKWFELAEKDSLVAEVLGLWGASPEPDWYCLWNIFERIRNSVGGRTVNTWMRSNRTTRFTQTAVHRRKGGGKGYPPHRKPMDEKEAREYIRELVRTWLDSESAPSQPENAE